MAFRLIKESTPESKESSLQQVGRYGAQAAAGVGAALPGVFGETGKFFHNVLANPAAKLLGQEEVPYEETWYGKLLPTTEQHRQTLEAGIPYLKPKNQTEKFVKDLATDAAEFYLGGRLLGGKKYAPSAMKSAAISLAANTAGKGTEAFTGSPEKGEMAKAGTMMFLSFLAPKTAKNLGSELYKKAEAALPSNAVTPATKFSNTLNNLETKILRGRPVGNVAASEKFVLDEINKFRNLIQGNQISMPSFVAQKTSFNEEMGKNVFNLVNRGDKARAKKLGSVISHGIKETMKDYGQTNPQWWKIQQQADNVHKTIADSNYISRAIAKYLPGRPDYMAHVFGIGVPGGLSFVSSPVAAGSIAGYQAAKIGYRIAKSPTLAKEYAKVARAALSENPKAINNALDVLQGKIEKDKEKNKKKYKIINQ